MPIPLLPAALGVFGLNALGAANNQGISNANLNRLLQLFSNRWLTGNTNQLFDMLKHSPMYSTLQNRALVGASSLGNQLQAAYAKRGLGGSALAQTAIPMARSKWQNDFNDIDMNLFAQALQQVLASRSAIAGAYQAYPKTNIFGTALGNTLEAGLPLVFGKTK